MKSSQPSNGLLDARFRALLILTGLPFAASLAGAGQDTTAWKTHDMNRPRPAVVTPGSSSSQDQPGQPPSDAVVLFDGSDLGNWRSMDGSPAKWAIKDSVMESVTGSGYIRTLRNFGDCQLHLEFATPVPASGVGQGRGNSGVFLMGKYEVQVLDSYDNHTYADGQAASVYGQYPPLVNACRPPGEWQSYDIIFTAPRFAETGELTSPARLTVLQNGVLVQNNVEVRRQTGWLRGPAYEAHPDKLPISLQDHGNPVRYRNIWVRELGVPSPPQYTFARPILDRYVGDYQLDENTILTIGWGRSDRLFAQVINSNSPDDIRSFPLCALSELKFSTEELDASVEFRLDDQSTARSLTFEIGGEARRARKLR